MKLKNVQPESTAAAPAAPAPGRAAIAARFQLDADDAGAKGPATVGHTAAMIALIGSLLAIALMGVVTWLLYTNWELIRDV